jgi:phosphoribosylformylglycinamidine cyclo-ligase
VSRLLESPVGGLTYEASGVSIDAGDEAVRRIRDLVTTTAREEVRGGIGGFGGLFELDLDRYRHPVLVSSADGVGTKLEIARLVGRYDTVGLDLVAMLVDDLACVGAEPLFLLDYVAVGSLDPARLVEIVAGVAEGCRQCGAALLGGETAEHGGVMRADDLDVAGFTVGVVERGEELGPHRVRDGDVIVGFGSPGLRSNGYSLARRALIDVESRLDEPAYAGAERTLGEELLVPSVIYVPAVLAQQREVSGAIHAVAHVTGGGIVGNVPRALPANLDAVIDMTAFHTPEIFLEIQRRGHVAPDEMVRVFNCGLGMTVFVDADAGDAAVAVARALGVDAAIVGEVVAGSQKVQLHNV